jgi:glutaminyl-peptide cyclotransferase
VGSAGKVRGGKIQPAKRKPDVRLALAAFWVCSQFFVVCSCKPGDTSPPIDSQKPQPDPNQAGAPIQSGAAPPPEKIWTSFDGRQALAEAKVIADFGPRPSGSDANKQVRQHLIDRLTNLAWQTSEQRLAERTPDGRDIEFCNLIAQFSRSSPAPRQILIGAHFDTPPTQEFQNPGASDGGANTAVLLELARILALNPQLAANVELLFLDGDAPFRELNLSDGLFGSRFYAQMLRINRHAGDIRAAILLDNVGSGILNYLPNSDPGLAGAMKKAATFLGVKLEPANRPLLADHVPFAQAGIPSLALLNMDSPFLNTADDTADRLDGESLAKTGSLILYFVSAERATQ